MARMVSRREALLFGAALAAGFRVGPTSAAPVPRGSQSKSWVGRTVLPKRSDVQGDSDHPRAPLNAIGTRRRALDSCSWEVKAEEGARAEVFENGIPYWVEKSRVVLLIDAVAVYTKAMAAADGQVDGYAHNFRGWAKYLLGKPEEAVKDFGEFIKQFPFLEGPGGSARATGLNNRGRVLAEMGMFDAGFKDLEESRTLGADYARLHRGWARHLMGDYGKAALDYAAVLELWPNDTLTTNRLAWLRATCPDAVFRDGKAAVKAAKELCELTDNREGTYLDTLAAAHAEVGDFDAAVKTLELAFEDAGFVRRDFDAARARLHLYLRKKPYSSAPLK